MTWPGRMGLGKKTNDSTRESALRAVVVSDAVSAPKFFVSPATHDTPQKPHAENTSMIANTDARF